MLKVPVDKSVKSLHIFVIRHTFSFEVKAVAVNPNHAIINLHNTTKQLKCVVYFYKTKCELNKILIKFVLMNVEDRVWFKIEYRISNFTAMLNIYFNIYVVDLLSRRLVGQ